MGSAVMLSSIIPVALLCALAFASSARALLQDERPHANIRRIPSIPPIEMTGLDGPVISRNGTRLPPYTTVYYFDQLIDHKNPSLGTFKQRYWHTYEFYERGGPIILMTPGENNAQGYSSYLSNMSIGGLIAQQQNGSTIMLEHRFYGFSNPKPDLSVASLKYHTIQQAIDDLLSPSYAPWVLVGGSYSGALTSWTMANKPGVFWAGYASSAVVEAILDFWQYFEPIREHMPQNCSADIQAVIHYADKISTSRDTKKIEEFKDIFGMGDVTHFDDVVSTLRNNLADWQSLQPSSGPGTVFYQFCDALEVENGVSASKHGWGLEHALNAWGSFYKRFYLQYLCGTQTPEACVGTYNRSQSNGTGTAVNNSARSWTWIVCNEVGYLQDAAPPGVPSLISRLVQPSYDLRQCQLLFPSAFPQLPHIQTQRINKVYKGWNVQNRRLFFANGKRDPWRESTMSAGPVKVRSTAEQPIMLGNGFHCSDLKTINGQVDQTVHAVQTSALGYMKIWLAEWTPPREGIST